MPRKPQLVAPGDPEMVFTTSGMGLTAQGDIGGIVFAFEQHIDATADEREINEIADRMRRVFARQKAQIDLGEKLLARQIALQVIEDHPEKKTRELRALADEKIRLRASFSAAHEGSNRRTEFRLTAPQQKALDSFDERLESAGLRIDAEKARMEADLPLIEKQIARLRAIIDGRDPDEIDMEAEAARLVAAE